MVGGMSEVAEAWATVVVEGKADTVGDDPFLSLFELDSGMAFGLTEGPRWARRQGDTLVVFSEQTAVSFVEAMEVPRRDFEATLEENAAARGMPGAETAWSFPAPALIRCMLASETLHFVGLALHWILPTELRALRPDIDAVTKREDISRSLCDFAVHLRVRE